MNKFNIFLGLKDVVNGLKNFFKQVCKYFNSKKSCFMFTVVKSKNFQCFSCTEKCEVRCAKSTKCIKHTQVCDGKKDCPQGDDEIKDQCSKKLLYNLKNKLQFF